MFFTKDLHLANSLIDLFIYQTKSLFKIIFALKLNNYTIINQYNLYIFATNQFFTKIRIFMVDFTREQNLLHSSSGNSASTHLALSHLSAVRLKRPEPATLTLVNQLAFYSIPSLPSIQLFAHLFICTALHKKYTSFSLYSPTPSLLFSSRKLNEANHS
jgi:hypothetical protein